LTHPNSFQNTEVDFGLVGMHRFGTVDGVVKVYRTLIESLETSGGLAQPLLLLQPRLQLVQLYQPNGGTDGRKIEKDRRTKPVVYRIKHNSKEDNLRAQNDQRKVNSVGYALMIKKKQRRSMNKQDLLGQVSRVRKRELLK
jgi:hypothetical protein